MYSVHNGETFLKLFWGLLDSSVLDVFEMIAHNTFFSDVHLQLCIGKISFSFEKNLKFYFQSAWHCFNLTLVVLRIPIALKLCLIGNLSI